MTSLVAVSLGSNIEAEKNIRKAVAELKTQFGQLTRSPVYKTAAVGFDGEDFLNLVVSFTTHKSVHCVAAMLKIIEDRLGRDRSQPKFSARSIDLDLLTYDELILDQPGVQIPRTEILENAFVLKPLSDILPTQQHPQLEKTYVQLWHDMQQNAGRIKLYELDFD